MTPNEIKDLRKRMGLTQVQLAQKLHVSFATLNRWERGHNKPLPDRMERLKELDRLYERKGVITGSRPASKAGGVKALVGSSPIPSAR